MHCLPPPEAPQDRPAGRASGLNQPLPVLTVTLRSEPKSSANSLNYLLIWPLRTLSQFASTR